MLREEIVRFAGLLSGADPATAVPTCPGWDLAALAEHIGATHRWVTAMVRSRTLEKFSFAPFGEAVPADPAELPAWLVEGADELISVFDATPPDTPVWAWGADQHVRFWSRRMLHEAAIHRADASLALGLALDIDAELAEDGVQEFLANLPHAGWVPGAAAVEGAGSAFALQATDTGSTWLITLDADGFSWFRAETTAGADVTVSATAADLYLFLYGRVSPPAVTGDAMLLSRWTAATAF